ncbi:radial spoke head 14 homolog [Electrophorus electricus]|uniref:Radial spoke head 14 homolog n=1 Tax=Electrophorus electricus TaxID=8005 RepID=A0A4W4EXC5_ELEEL|nr:radial spoke head 14 homolog [Electrophorus electricus]
MAGTRISERLPPRAEPTHATVAFGDRALPRLSAELQHVELRVRQGALAALGERVHDAERAYEAIRAGILDRLKLLLKDEEGSVRTRTAEVLYLLATHSVGREAMLRTHVVPTLSGLLDEPVHACRKNIHQTLKMLAEFPAGVSCMVASGLVPRLLMRVPEEQEDVRALVLSTLSSCMREDALPALANGGVAVLKEQLSHTCPDIRRAATSATLAISVPVEGKRRLCEEDVLPILVGLLSDHDLAVSANAAGAIMNTAVITKGKVQALETGVIQPLLCLLGRGHTAACTNALRALTCLAEVPSARQQLLPHLPLLESLLRHPAPIIQRAGSTAIQVVSWTP